MQDLQRVAAAPGTVHYFAYGSNMAWPRLAARVAIAGVVGTATLNGHRLAFHKIGRDGSGKCDAARGASDADRVIGVVYRLAADQLPTLDRFEGVGSGYAVQEVDVTAADGQALRCRTYLATRTDPTLQPFCWYREHVLRGAIALRLPAAYVESIRATGFVPDPDLARRRRELQIYARDDG